MVGMQGHSGICPDGRSTHKEEWDIIRQRKEGSTEILYGRRTVLEVLNQRPVIKQLCVASGIKLHDIELIVETASRRGIRISEVTRKDMDAACGTSYHQGVTIEVKPRPRMELRQWLTGISSGHSIKPVLVLLLDGVTDPHNLGALMRTAEAASVDAVIIPRRRSCPLTPVVHKAASGACEYLDVVTVPNISSAIESLKKAGLWVIGLDPAADGMHTEEDFKIPLALVLGSEGKGISQLVKKRCDTLVKLPMLGHVASLNVSVAGGVILYEVVRQRAKGSNS